MASIYYPSQCCRSSTEDLNGTGGFANLLDRDFGRLAGKGPVVNHYRVVKEIKAL
jgi:hypothetical protein